jgi:hypothetical protein
VLVSQSSDATGANGTAGATGEGHFNGYCTGLPDTWMAIVKDAGFVAGDRARTRVGDGMDARWRRQELGLAA